MCLVNWILNVGSMDLIAVIMERSILEVGTRLLPASCLAYSSALKMQTKCFFETSVDIQRTLGASAKGFVSFQFLNLKKVGRTPWTGDQPVARPLPTHRTTQTQNKRRQTSMP
jgi:hypothetical protein